MEKNNSNTRWLFFVEREFHIGLFAGLIHHIHENQWGRIGIYSFGYQPSKSGHRGRGARPEAIRQTIDVPFEVVNNPYAFNPEYTFLADSGYEWVEGAGKLINIGHGTICKGSFYTRKPISRRENCADLLCVPGSIHRSELFHQVYQPISVTGMPKLDPMFNGSLKREELLSGWGLDPEKKTVLFAPTFNHEYSLIPHLQIELENYFPAEYNLLFKLHSITPEEWREPFIRYADKHPHAVFIDQADITPALAAADLLITDISSVIYEFGATGKPVLLFDSPDYKTKFDENDLEHRFRDIGTRFTDPGSLFGLIQSTIIRNDSTETRDIARKFVSVTDGSATQRVFQSIASLNDRKQATIVIGNARAEEVEFYQKRYGNRFDLIFTAPYFTSQHEKAHMIALPDYQERFGIAQSLQAVQSKLATELVIYLDSEWNASSLLPLMLCGQFHFNKDVDVFVPMVSNQVESPEQKIGTHFAQTYRLPDERINGPLTYYKPGFSAKIEEGLPFCFITRKENLGNLSKYNRIENGEILRSLGPNHHVAFDAFVWKKDRLLS